MFIHRHLSSLDDAAGLSVAADFELAVSALGACVWCLKRARLDYSLLSLASFEVRFCDVPLFLYCVFAHMHSPMIH
jgi:hypothetical protein